MAEELSYVLVTPYSIRKSRTGGILARLISRTGLDLVAARMFAPSGELVEKYAAGIVTDPDPTHRATQELIKKYVLKNFTPTGAGAARPRVLMLVFKGEDAVSKIRATVGHIVNERTSGETIRDTYGDYVDGREWRSHLLRTRRARAAGCRRARAATICSSGRRIRTRTAACSIRRSSFPPGAKVEKTLVLIKPDNFRFPNARPGGVIDLFSRTGLYIIACKVHRMSVAQAEEFYGPVLDVLQDKLRERSGETAARPCSAEEFNYRTRQGRAKRNSAKCSARSPDAKTGSRSWQVHGGHQAERMPRGSARRARDRKSASRFATRASMPCARSAKCSGRPIPRRRRPERSVASSARPSWSMPRTPPIRRKMPQREMGIVKIAENNLKPLIESWFAKK